MTAPWIVRLFLAVSAVSLAACGGNAPTAAESARPASAASEPSAGAKHPAASEPSDASEPRTELEPSEPFGTTTVELSAPDGATTITMPVYDAFLPDARRRGLMHREELARDAGMVFRFPDDRTGGFWMKNTLIPLSIAYYDAAGTVVAVLDMEPCTSIDCPSYPPGAVYRGALEVNQGYFSEIGLEPGWRVTLPDGLPTPS